VRERRRFQRSFNCDPEAIRQLLGEAQAWMIANDLPAVTRAEAELVLAEVMNNIAEHAYDGGPGSAVLRLKCCAGGIFCLISDRGRPMPGDAPPGGAQPDLDVARAELPEGGFGWRLIRMLTSDLRFGRKAGRNRLGFVLDGRSWR
jgi:serine/threonine-protein kinase RsbW